MGNIIDPHVHLFNLEQGQYEWLKAGKEPDWPDKDKISKDYSESDLELNTPNTLSGFVHIEAGFDNQQPWRELQWLEAHCTLPFKSIAYLDLTSESANEHLDMLSQFNSLAGVRYILDESAAELFASNTFQRNLKLLEEKGLIFEVQYAIENRSATSLLNQLLDNLPALKVVINHAGFPQTLTPDWMSAVTELAHHPECYVKCSGWEMFNRDWQVDEVKLLINFVIREFGLTRVMLASNFPVSELSCSYSELWLRLTKEMKWKGFEKQMLIEDNASRIYGFE